MSNTGFWADRKIVYISPMVAVLLGVAFLGLLALLNRDFVSGWFSHVTPAPANSIRGQWVGHVDIAGIHDPWLRDMKKGAVIRFDLGITDSFLEKYGGHGELTIGGEQPRGIEVKGMLLDKPSGEYEAGWWLDGYKPNDSQDLVSGGISGVFKAGSLSIKREDQVGYIMIGTLHKGTAADYAALVRELR